MDRSKIAFLAALAITTWSCSGHVVDTSVVPGDRVRVTAPRMDLNKSVGSVAALHTDTVVFDVQDRSDALGVPLAHVTKLEVHRGQKSMAGRGALIGAGFGTAIGLGLAVAICSGDNCTSASGDQYGLAIAAAVVLGVGAVALGAGIGALAGLTSKTDRWENVPLDQLRVGPSPVGADGLAVSVTLRL
ncbi:MAG: hypothetical protein JSU87_14030 [Gemmatimonadota bacterium]|nr:MAG: hypothetical protein JSU87_14030 [Gemmatimonadota bacterium]